MHSNDSSGARRVRSLHDRTGPTVAADACRRRWATHFALCVLLIVTAVAMSACSAGSGGNNGANPPRSQLTPVGLAFTYPYNGQQDVPLDAQLVVQFTGDISGGMEGALTLQANGSDVGPAITVETDDNQPGILRLNRDGDLQGDTTYSVVATQSIGSGPTSFNAGDTLYRFKTRPAEGRPVDGPLEVVEVTPGETNPITGETSVFTQFNAVRIVFSEPVNPATVTQGDSFSFTGADGNEVEGRLTTLGRYITFDPTDDLAPGTYTVQLNNTVTSQFGKSLQAFTTTRTVLDAGDTATENTFAAPTIGDNGIGGLADLPDNNLNGLTVNNVNIASQLIGSNDQPVMNADSRGGVLTTLAQPAQPGFGDVFPAVVRGGQKFQLTGLKLKLNGDIQTPVATGPIDVNFNNDASIYLMANDYRNIEAPTQVRIRFDLGIGTLIDAAAGTAENVIQSLGNGVFNQSVLNIQAAGLAIPQDNGDLAISAIGTFPVNVNRTGGATVDFELTLVLPAGDQPDIQDDTTAPFITAQYPSACLYAFGSPAYDQITTSQGAPATVLPEQVCTDGSPDDDDGDAINSFPIESSPALVFSEPIEPASIDSGSVQLTGGGNTVNATYRAEGFSVVIDPVDPLDPDTEYTINLNTGSQLTDLAGNAVTFDNTLGPQQSITFTTEPRVDTDPTAPLLGALTPGVPCALENGDFISGGGDTAGNCAGDDGTGSTPFTVFQNPVNIAVDAYFSKFVESDSIVLADGCLTPGSGDSNTVAGATVAVQEMDGSGQCVRQVPGEIALRNPGDAVTRGFTFRPSGEFQQGTRYWIVVCGTERSANSSCADQIVDVQGNALNTDPLAGSGSTPNATDGAGGPDIVMPFDGIAATDAFVGTQFTLPATDTNGNGQFDDGENAQIANVSYVNLTAADGAITIAGEQDDGSFASYLSLPRPVAIRGTLDDCSVLDAVADDGGNSAVGDIPDQCIQVSLLPGGINALTSINIGIDALLSSVTASLEPVLGPLQDALDQAMSTAGSDPTQTVGGSDATAGVADAINQVLGTVGGLLSSTTDATSGVTDGGTTSADTGGTGTLDPTALASAVAGTPLEGPVTMLLDSTTTLGDLQSLLDNPTGLAGNLLDTILMQLGISPDAADPVQTGRVILRFPNATSGEAAVSGGNNTQSGYILERCTGTLPGGGEYDYEPCFAASLTLIANAPDSQGVDLPQQTVTANVVGPVAFQQNGRLTISVRNFNTLTLNAQALGLLDSTATINPGDLHLQLTGNAVHGGRAFPER